MRRIPNMKKQGVDSKMTHTCQKCGITLNDDNWTPSNQRRQYYICKGCVAKRSRKWYRNHRALTITRAKQWHKANPEKAKAHRIKVNRKQGVRPFNENKKCASFLGVHIAEQVLSQVFKDVEVMPMHNPGYDFICNKGKKIDVKSACPHSRGRSILCWRFSICHNKIADYFLCLAFDNRKDLNPVHIWLIPGIILNHLHGTSISITTIDKWSRYELTEKLNDVILCCDTMKGDES